MATPTSNIVPTPNYLSGGSLLNPTLSFSQQYAPQTPAPTATPKPTSTPSLSSYSTTNTGLVSPQLSVQTTTPAASTFKPNTATNIAYGGATSVPTGQFTSTPAGGLVTPTTPTNVLTGQQGVSGLIQPPSAFQQPAAQTTTQPTTQPTPPAAQTGTTATTEATGTQQQVPQTPSAVNQSYAGLIAQLTQLAQQGSPGLNQAIQNLANFNQQLAQQYAGIESQAIPLEFQQGREQVLARQAASQQAALQGAVTQQQSALGQQLGALGTAAGLAAPVTQFGVLTSPQTGQPITPGTTAGGAAFTGGQIGQQQQQGAQYQQYQGAYQSAQGLQQQLSNLLNTSGVNPSDLNAVNRFFQAVAGQTSNPQYQTFQNLINDLASRYATILTPAGGNPTDYKTQIAKSFLDASMSGQGLMQVIKNLDSQAQAVMSGLQSAGTGQGATQGTTQGTGGSNLDPLGIL